MTLDKTTKILAWLAGIVIIAIILLVVFGNGSPTGNVIDSGTGPIKIGLISPLTGSAASIGIANKNAVELAVKEVNDEGGINGRPLQLIVEDSKNVDPKEATTAMQKLVNVDKVTAVFNVGSGATLASHPVAEAGKVIHFGIASNPKISDAGDYLFRACPSDDYAGKVAAKYIKETMKINKVAVLKCDNDWCTGLADAFVQSYTALGGEVLIQEQIKVDTADARTELSKIKETNPELVYFTGYPGETITVFKQAKELGISVPFFGGDAWTDESIAKETQGTVGKVYFTTPSSSYSSEFAEKIGGNVAIGAAESYDSIHIVAQVMRKVGTNTEKIKDELYKVRNYHGQSGIIGIDAKGDLLGGALDIKTLQGGKIVDYAKGVTA
ncbi:Chemotactic signal transduction system substrate-binding protein BasB [uncultured archaeon]|nr:Chemotactic signal transduction system substrate-binding protein BasB [uncultured archaeon]